MGEFLVVGEATDEGEDEGDVGGGGGADGGGHGWEAEEGGTANGFRQGAKFWECPATDRICELGAVARSAEIARIWA